MLMQARWGVILLAASTAIGMIDVALAQKEESLGKTEFLRSCASCHGTAGKGDGPVAKSLVKPPADLTGLSEKNNGVFPITRVYEVIDGRFQILIHGTRDMPVWGDAYMQGLVDPTSRGFTSKALAETLVRTRILMLVEYISTLQDKKTAR
jgi:mono/diheme cytochrome c family protein